MSDPLDTPRSNVLVIYTGGTLGMKPNAEGSLEPSEGYLEEVMSNMEELTHPTMPLWTLRLMNPIMDSSDMGPKDWKRIATEIETNYLDYDGFLVIMGTDTMAYAASAMSFILHNLAKPVIFTGSIIPFASPWNDARRNLIVSLMFATCAELCEVCIYFGGRLLRGNRSRKLSSVDVQAFDSPNFPPLGELSALRFGPNGQVKLNKYLLLPRPRGRLKVHKDVQIDVLVVKLNPTSRIEDLKSTVEKAEQVRAMVLELYGSRNGRQAGQLAELVRLGVAKGLILVICNQCVRGRVSVAPDKLGGLLIAAGAVSAKDMTTEAVVTKLGILLGCGYNAEKVKALMQVSLCGEMNVETDPSSRL
eukprot:GGOE01019435.1.p1 GENE.GGOE01019435.1~~GGOE01019435.1.p1  ORF type:complete len:386 (+),score=122.30 GGOE01019435.1:78-1160(+)